VWIWFKCDWWKWPIRCPKVKWFSWQMTVQNDNRVRNPNTNNLGITHCIMCNGIDWATFHNNSTFIEFCRGRITTCLSPSERLHHESEVTEPVNDGQLIEGKSPIVSQSSTCVSCDKIEGKVWHLWETEWQNDRMTEGQKQQILRSDSDFRGFIVS
jgi:hypothetical protein